MEVSLAQRSACCFQKSVFRFTTQLTQGELLKSGRRVETTTPFSGRNDPTPCHPTHRRLQCRSLSVLSNASLAGGKCLKTCTVIFPTYLLAARRIRPIIDRGLYAFASQRISEITFLPYYHMLRRVSRAVFVIGMPWYIYGTTSLASAIVVKDTPGHHLLGWLFSPCLYLYPVPARPTA